MACRLMPFADLLLDCFIIFSLIPWDDLHMIYCGGHFLTFFYFLLHHHHHHHHDHNGFNVILAIVMYIFWRHFKLILEVKSTNPLYFFS